jgi:hypothetical protein
MHHAGYIPVAGVTTEAGWLRCKLDLAEEPSVTNKYRFEFGHT